MKPERIFYQDFLFEDLPVDEQDNPKVDVIFSSKKDENAVNLSLDVLMRMNRREEWNDLIAKIKDKKVAIIDDIPLANKEVEPYKKMYLAAYFHYISRECIECVAVE